MSLRSSVYRVVALAPVVALSACSDGGAMRLTIDRVGPTYVPVIAIQGTPQRIAALTVSGAPTATAPFLERAVAEGWQARPLSDGVVQIDPVGHSLDEVTALNFRIDNGEFGDVRMKVMLRPDTGKRI